MRSNGIENLQVVRAIAALSVVVDHAFATPFNGLISDSNYNYIHHALNCLGAFGVDVFFVLSGFLMVFTQKDSKTSYRFIKDRVIRIYPAYIIYSTPVIIYAILSSGYDHGINNITQLVQNYALLPGVAGLSYNNANYPGWTLVYEMFFYFTFSACLMITRDKARLTVMISTIFIAMLLISRLAFDARNDDYQLTDFNFISGNMIIIDFVFGCFLGLLGREGKVKIGSVTFIFSVIFIFSSATFALSMLNIPEDKNLVSIFISTMPATIIIYFSIRSREVDCNFLQLIGNASYSIYLTHVTILILSRKVMDKLNLSDSISIVILVHIAFIITSVVLGLIAYRFVEKPIIDIMKGKPKNIATISQ